MTNKYLRLIRIKHWLKNILIFLPLFFSRNLSDISMLLKSVLAFITFSLVASIVYIINDINDLENDKLHHTKKTRPLASGEISKKQAILILTILAVLAVIVASILYDKNQSISVFLIPIIYIIINIFYSKGLKSIPIIDITILVIGFILRVMYGGVVINIEISKYLYLMVIFGAYYLGFGKRRNEILKNGEKSREVLKLYNKNFLDKNMYVSMALAVFSYTLWCVDINTIKNINHDYLFWTVPLLLLILQMYSLDIEKDSDGDPIEVIISDKKILITVIIYLLVIGGILYLI